MKGETIILLILIAVVGAGAVSVSNAVKKREASTRVTQEAPGWLIQEYRDTLDLCVDRVKELRESQGNQSCKPCLVFEMNHTCKDPEYGPF